MRKRFRSYFYLLLSFIMIFAMSVPVYADRSDVDASVTLQTGLGEVAKVCSQANDTCGKKILVYTGSDGVLSFSNTLYSELEMEQKREFMEVALRATNETSLGAQQKNKLYNFIAKQDSSVSAAIKYLKSDASADFVEAKAWFSPFSGPISTVIGLLCLCIFTFLALSIVFDIAYLVLPMFQAVLEHGNDNKRPIGVSREAWQTVLDMNSGKNEGRNVLSVYMSKRVPVMIICSICLGYLISGKIYDLMVFFVDAFSAI